LLFLALALSACGATDEEKIRSTIDKYGEALANGDPRKACQQVVGPDDNRCQAQFTVRILALDNSQRDALRDIKVDQIRIVGRVAEVSAKDDLLPPNTRLRKEGQYWRIEPASLGAPEKG
jgi:hypothetical protein